MPTFALAATGAGLISAVLHATLLTGQPGLAVIFSNLAQLPLFLVGLWVGFAAATLATAVGLLTTILLGGLTFAMIYMVATALPAVALVYLLQMNRSGSDGSVEFLRPGILVAWLTGSAAAIFLGTAIAFIGVPGGIEGAIQPSIQATLAIFTGDRLDQEALAAAAATFARIFPGVAAVFFVTKTVLNAAIAQGLLVRSGRNFRPSPSISDIELPDWMQGALVIAAIGAFFPGAAGFVGSNLLLIFTLAFALAGLGVLHAIVGRFGNRTLMLVGIYAFVFLFGWPAVLLALLGIAEPWLNLRRRYGGGSGT